MVELDGTNALLQTGAALATDQLVIVGCLEGGEIGAAAGPFAAAGGCLVGGTAGYLAGQSRTLSWRAAGFGGRTLAVSVRSQVECNTEGGGTGAPVFPPGAQVDPHVTAFYAWNALIQDLPWAWRTLVHGR